MQSFFQIIYFIFIQVKIAALQNLVKIMSLYYDYMVAYMGPALFAVSRFHYIVETAYSMAAKVRAIIWNETQCTLICPTLYSTLMPDDFTCQ